MHITTNTRPDWATIYDRAVDVSDVWQDATDPANEYGEVCEAYLAANDVACTDEHHRDFTGAGFTLVGLAVRDGYGSGVTYHSRERAITILGMSSVWAIELHEMECAI